VNPNVIEKKAYPGRNKERDCDEPSLAWPTHLSKALQRVLEQVVCPGTERSRPGNRANTSSAILVTWIALGWAPFLLSFFFFFN
jgi:hypothetical protein